MRIIRYKTKDSDEVHVGWTDGEQAGPIMGDVFGMFRRLEATLSMDDVRLLPPVHPGKIICVGRNYAAHAEEHGAKVPEYPLLFLKPPSSILGHGGIIRLPPQSAQVEHEGELALVIGKRGRWIATENAYDHVFGYTVANDVTARDLQRKDNQWTRGKGYDTFCPFGPWVDTEFSPIDRLVTVHVNGEMRQMASTRDMVYDIPRVISFASTFMTLEPGDLLLTGTPAGVGPLLDGDEVTVTVDGLGTLKNIVATEVRS